MMLGQMNNQNIVFYEIVVNIVVFFGVEKIEFFVLNFIKMFEYLFVSVGFIYV